MMHLTRALIGIALLAVCGVSATAIGAERALAGKSGKPKTINCSSSSACVTATNQGGGPGVTSTSEYGDGIAAYSSSSIASAVYGENDASAGGTGVKGRSVGDYRSTAFVADAGKNGSVPLYLTQSFSGFSYMFLGSNANGPVLAAGNTGNLTIAGELYTTVDCPSGCSRTRRVRMYGGTASQPTLADGGEASLSAGVATVRLDSRFRNAIDGRRYVVFVTPEAATKGLYVSERSDDRFIVREIHGGRGSVPFAYRIVARPYHVAAPRLPVVHDLRATERLGRVAPYPTR